MLGSLSVFGYDQRSQLSGCPNRRIRLLSIVCSHPPPLSTSFLPRAVLCGFLFNSIRRPMTPSIFHSSLQEIVERNIKASRVCNPTIVDVRLIPMGNVESDPGRGQLGRRPDLRRRGWRMYWVGQRRPDMFYSQQDCKP
jgi:hypothetical protein